MMCPEFILKTSILLTSIDTFVRNFYYGRASYGIFRSWDYFLLVENRFFKVSNLSGKVKALTTFLACKISTLILLCLYYTRWNSPLPQNSMTFKTSRFPDISAR